MENKKEMVKSLEAMLDMLPDNLTEEEKKKTNELREMLEKIEKQIEKENNTALERQTIVE